MNAKIEVEVREIGNKLDEVLLYVDGKCLFHLEEMDFNHWWMGVGDAEGQFVHVNLFTKRAFINVSWKQDSKIPPTEHQE